MNQFVCIKVYDIYRLCVDFRPEGLKFRHGELFLINLKLNIVAAGIFRLHCFWIIDGVNDIHDRSRRISHLFCNLQSAIGLIFVIFLGKCAPLINVAVDSQVVHDSIRSIFIDNLLTTIGVYDNLAHKQIYSNCTRTICNCISDFTLQTFCERIIAFAGNDGQDIDIMNIVTKNIAILALTILVDAEA